MSLDGHSESNRLLPELLEETFVNRVHLNGSEYDTTNEALDRTFTNSSSTTTTPTTSTANNNPSSNPSNNPSNNPPSHDTDGATQFTEFRDSPPFWQLENEERESRHRLPQRLRRRQLDAEERDDSERYFNIEWMLLQPISSLSGDVANAGLSINIFHIYGNIGVYAGALDSVMNQLLSQIDESGVPPAEKEMIDSIPKVEITQEQVDKSLHCAICLLDFQLKEIVKQLCCLHQYHGDCIDKWLSLHGNCPICREDLMSQKSSPLKGLSPIEEEGDENQEEEDDDERHLLQSLQFPPQ